MGLASKLEEAIKQSDPFENWISGLDDDDRAALVAAAGNQKLSTKRLANIIREEGGKVGDDRLNRWRRDNGYAE